MPCSVLSKSGILKHGSNIHCSNKTTLKVNHNGFTVNAVGSYRWTRADYICFGRYLARQITLFPPESSSGEVTQHIISTTAAQSALPPGGGGPLRTPPKVKVSGVAPRAVRCASDDFPSCHGLKTSRRSCRVAGAADGGRRGIAAGDTQWV